MYCDFNLNLKILMFKETNMKIPYGLYLNEKNEVCIDNERAKVIAMIFDMYIDSISLRKISNMLNEKGCFSPTGKSNWSAQSIDNIIRNSKYIPIVSFEKYIEACFARERR